MRSTSAYAYLLLAIGLPGVPAICLATSTEHAATQRSRAAPVQRARYIVQARTTTLACDSVRAVDGEVLQELKVINGVSALLTSAQAQQLSTNAALRLFKDRPLATSSGKDLLAGKGLQDLLSLVFTDGTAITSKGKSYATNYPMLVGADTLQQDGIRGKGVTIAILDSGFWPDASDNVKPRVLGSIDFVTGGSKPVLTDPFGHGTHITSIAAGSFGIAPDAKLVIVRAFDGNGVGSYTNVIAGLDWIIANRLKYKIRVLNLSFGAPPQSNYWDDPLNQAVMTAWRSGIVVVTAAGNEGPTPMTIGVPGNVPYVITVGAQTDNYTPFNPLDDRLASFSSTGPTLEGFVKPEIIAPGGHMVASMWYQSYLANIDPDSMKRGDSLFTMSGTSQAAAITSGIVALMLQSDPTLSPDAVKCRLMASASPAVTFRGARAYSVFQQGAGLVSAIRAVSNVMSGCANQGLDIDADLAGTQHFGGPANQDADGNYYVMNMDGSTWGEALSGDGYTWSKGIS